MTDTITTDVLGEGGKRAIDRMKAQLKNEINLRHRAEEKYSDLMQGIAQSVIKELRGSKWIEIHQEKPEVIR